MRVSEVRDLTERSARHFREKVQPSLLPFCRTVEIDLSQTAALDSWGLAELIAVYKIARQHDAHAVVRLLRPRPPVQQILDLTRAQRLFEVVTADVAS